MKKGKEERGRRY